MSTFSHLFSEQSTEPFAVLPERLRDSTHVLAHTHRHSQTHSREEGQLGFLPRTARNTWHGGRLPDETFCQGESRTEEPQAGERELKIMLP